MCGKKVLKLRMIATLILITVLIASDIRAQERPIVQLGSAPDVISPIAKNVAMNREQGQAQEHGFWDRENNWLFAGVGAARTLDYLSTRNMRRRGRQEILFTNDVVDNHAAFAALEAAGTGASIGASYVFHRFGHHKLERWASIVHIELATTGAARNYCLKTAHPAAAPP